MIERGLAVFGHDKSYARQTQLQPLSSDDSLDVVRSVLRAEHLVDLLTQEIVSTADGNPFFLEQLALHAGEAKLRPGNLSEGTAQQSLC